MCGMQVAAIDRELRGLQSELESLQGRFDTERFLGASWKDFSDVMNQLVKEKKWKLESVTSGGILRVGATTTYTVRALFTHLDVRINRSSAQIRLRYLGETWDTYKNPVDFKNALDTNLWC
jgi:hypothetical protein